MLTISGLLEIDVGVTEGAAGDDVPAHADGHDGSRRRELLIQHGLRDVRMQVAYVQRGQRVHRPTAVHPASSATVHTHLKRSVTAHHQQDRM